jgi:putative PIN family toxin of toxin-antitoxin system
MLRVVADTNILISALMFGGLPGMFLDLAILRSFVLVTSPILLDELDEKLRLKFKVSAKDAVLVRAKLEANSEVVKPEMRLTVIAEDPDDDRVLECAVAGKAAFVLSGDRHLLKLGSYEGIPILSVRQFMETIEADY